MFQPRYEISPKTLNNIAQIEVLKQRLETTPLLPKQELSFKKKAAVRMAQSSTSIEGNILNQGEVEKVFIGKSTQAPPKDELEVRNYQKAIAFISQEATSDKLLSTKVVLQAHQILMEGLLPPKKVGRFRQGPVFVVNAYETHDEVVYQAPKASSVPKLVGDLTGWVRVSRKEGLSPIIQAGLIHHELAAIHPFSDGNGRVARLLTMYNLYASNYEIKKIYTLDTYYNQDRQAYYTAIHGGKNYTQSQKSDLTTWLEYFTTGFAWELSKINDQISAIRVRPRNGKTAFIEKDLLRLLDFAISMGRITSLDVKNILGVSRRTAQLKLRNLTERDLLKKIGRGPSTHFIPNTS